MRLRTQFYAAAWNGVRLLLVRRLGKHNSVAVLLVLAAGIVGWIGEHYYVPNVGRASQGICVWLFISAVAVYVLTRKGRRIVRATAVGTVIALPIAFAIAVATFAIEFIIDDSPASGPDIVYDCAPLISAANSTGFIPQSLSEPRRTAIYCSDGMGGVIPRRRDYLQIYGVTTSARQNQVVDALLRTKKEKRTHPIFIMFYDRENWIHNLDGSAYRGPEQLIRNAIVN